MIAFIFHLSQSGFSCFTLPAYATQQEQASLTFSALRCMLLSNFHSSIARVTLRLVFSFLSPALYQITHILKFTVATGNVYAVSPNCRGEEKAKKVVCVVGCVLSVFYYFTQQMVFNLKIEQVVER